MKGANTTMKRLARKTRRARAAIVPFAAALLAALSPAPAARAADAADFARCVDVTVAYAPGEALADFPALVRLGPSIPRAGVAGCAPRHPRMASSLWPAPRKGGA